MDKSKLQLFMENEHYVNTIEQLSMYLNLSSHRARHSLVHAMLLNDTLTDMVKNDTWPLLPTLTIPKSTPRKVFCTTLYNQITNSINAGIIELVNVVNEGIRLTASLEYQTIEFAKLISRSDTKESLFGQHALAAFDRISKMNTLNEVITKLRSDISMCEMQADELFRKYSPNTF